MQFEVLVETSLRPGVADPQGATVERSMAALGFEGFAGVRIGKAMRFTVEAESEDAARARVEDACSRFLTNPVIEDATISLTAVAAGAPA